MSDTLITDKSRYFVTAEEILQPSEARETFRNHFLAVFVPLYTSILVHAYLHAYLLIP